MMNTGRIIKIKRFCQSVFTTFLIGLPVGASASTVTLETHGPRAGINGFVVGLSGTSSYSAAIANFNRTSELSGGELIVQSGNSGAISNVRISQASSVPGDYVPLGSLSVSAKEIVSAAGVVGAMYFSYDYFDFPYQSSAGKSISPASASSQFTYVIRAQHAATIDVSVNQILGDGNLLSIDKYSLDFDAGESQVIRLSKSLIPDFFQDYSSEYEFNISIREDEFNFVPRVVPLPASGILLLLGLAGAAGALRRKKYTA